MFTVKGCNAIFKTTKAYYHPRANFKDVPEWIELQVDVKEWNNPFTLTLFVKDVNAKSLSEKCSPLFFRNKAVCNSFRSEFFSDLSNGLKSDEIKCGYYFDETGANTLADGSICFLRGSELLGLCSRPYLCTPEFCNIRLLGNREMPNSIPLLLLSSQLPVLLVFSYVLLVSIRSLLIQNGISLQAVLYIEGGQGLGKTTLAERIAGIYEEHGKRIGVIQAGSTLSAVNTQMILLRDQPVIIDDLCKSISRNTEKRRIELASNLIRQATGDIPIIKKNGKTTEQLPCEAGVILTAEFTLNNLSDLTRCLIVPVKEQMNMPDELRPELIGDVVRYYSAWFATHSDEEIGRLQSEIAHYYNPFLDARMRTNYACLSATFESFLRFLSSNNLHSSVNTLRQMMAQAISYAINEHIGLIEEVKRTIPVGNLACCLLEGYKSNMFELKHKPVNLHKIANHDGIMWQGDLCLRKEPLTQFVQSQPGYQGWSSRDIVQELKKIGALVLQENGAATVHLDKDSPRVYRIRLDALWQNARRY